MIIILEGVDGVGKTTAVDMLVQTYMTMRPTAVPPLVLHRGVPVQHPLVEYELALEGIERSMEMTKLIICDRWHYGEMVYGPLYRGESLLGRAGKLHIDMFLAARGALLVHMTNSVREVEQRLGVRGDDYVKREHVGTIIRDYHRVLKDPSPLRRMTIHGSLAPYLMGIMRESMYLADRARLLKRHPTYVGPPYPDVLLVGDEKGSRHLGNHRAAFVPYDSTSGRFLLESLPERMWNSTGITNSHPDEEDVRELISDCGISRVVALGVKAHRRLEDLGVPHGRVPHPQYVRRFHNWRRVEYGLRICEAAEMRGDHSKWLSS